MFHWNSIVASPVLHAADSVAIALYAATTK
jgi:hypothetical protein